MIELLTESTFEFSRTSEGKHVLKIFKECNDGICHVGDLTQEIILSNYGIDAFEKNIKSLLLALLRYTHPSSLLEIMNMMNDK
jgi:hypothetical protein